MGQPQEQAFWKERGASDGTPLRLRVRRRRMPGDGWETLEIAPPPPARRAQLPRRGGAFAARRWRSPPPDPGRLFRSRSRGTRSETLTGSGRSRHGLDRHHRHPDGTGPSHGSRASDALPVGALSRDVLPRRPRQLDGHAGSARRACLPVPEQEYAYRDAEKQLTASISEAARRARDAFRAAHAADVIAHPGTIRIAEGDHEKLAGKAILQIFKANREKVAAYERDNNLSKTNNVRARAIAAVMQWAQAQPTDALKYDATLFATEVASSLQAAYDRSKGMDDSFRSKFNGLFTGPLSDGNLEILSERYVYEQQLGGLKGRGGDRKLLATADQLKSNLSAELDKSIVPLTTAAAEFPPEAGEILLLHAKEFRELLAQEVDVQIRELIKASLELSQKLSAQGISQDFDRGEILNALR